MHTGKRLRSSMPRPEAGRPGKLQSILRYVHADEGYSAPFSQGCGRPSWLKIDC